MTTKGSFYVQIYNCTVHIIVADDLQRSINYYLRKCGEKPLKKEEIPGAYCLSPDDDCSFEYYLFFGRKTIDINYINHEKSHLVEFILEERGIKAKDETRAYLDGFLSEKINALLKKRKIKLKG